MNPLRHDFIRTCLPPTPSPPHPHISYLDIGCGGGIFATSAARLPTTQTVTAIDPTPPVITIAQTHQRRDPALSPPRLTYLNCAIEDLPSSVQKVDIITLFEVLEHISSPSAFLHSCAKHLKPGGWIIGSTIARSWTSFLTTKVIAEMPLLGVVPRGTHDWGKYINPDELKGWFEKEGWEEWRTRGVVYLPAVGWRVRGGERGMGELLLWCAEVFELIQIPDRDGETVQHLYMSWLDQRWVRRKHIGVWRLRQWRMYSI